MMAAALQELFSCLSRLSLSHVAICVSRVLLDGLQKKRDCSQSTNSVGYSTKILAPLNRWILSDVIIHRRRRLLHKFQLFAINNNGTSSNQIPRDRWVAKTNDTEFST